MKEFKDKQNTDLEKLSESVDKLNKTISQHCSIIEKLEQKLITINKTISLGLSIIIILSLAVLFKH